MKRDLSKRLSNAAFCSILYGSTNSCIKEQEVIYVTYFYAEPQSKKIVETN